MQIFLVSSLHAKFIGTLRSRTASLIFHLDYEASVLGISYAKAMDVTLILYFNVDINLLQLYCRSNVQLCW